MKRSLLMKQTRALDKGNAGCWALNVLKNTTNPTQVNANINIDLTKGERKFSFKNFTRSMMLTLKMKRAEYV